ncbi:MAG: apolipoprotein N-acyltransferase [Mycobacterium sp.]|jgi:apolipoprotein N-acyltransferase|nr:apolipoprotein N-acyltransferase [Mycobacterium sp.]MDT5333343.1 apolipoprotein N-acyltransferase [Mycobacterium sp.]
MAKSGRRREWAKATDDTDIFPAIDDDEEADPTLTEEDDKPAESGRFADVQLRLKRFGQAVLDRLPQLGVVIVAGLALCMSFPPFGWWYLAIAAFAMLAWVLTRESTTFAGGFGYGFLFGLAFYLPLLPWIGGFVGAVPWFCLCVLEALFPALFGLGAVAARRLSGWPFWFAALWAAQEWLKSTVPFGGFPWGVVGFSQTDGPLLAIAQLGGAPLLSFAAVLIGFSLAAITFEVVKWWQHNDESQKSAPPAVVLPGVCISAVLLTTALAWPHVRQSGLGAGDDPSITVAAVQGNVPRLGLEFNAQRRAVLDNHVRETAQLSDDVRAGRAPQPMVVIWPENSSDIDPLANPDARDEISIAAADIKAPILVGGVVAAPGYSADNPVATNSVIVWNPATGPGDRHDKKIVQPFGEYLPWRGFFRHLSSYADRAGYFVPGSGSGVVNAAGVPIGVMTCWEVIFDRAARESVQNGAQLLTVPSNNATFNEAMSEQQLAFGRLRAVEHDRYVVVAGTTGISAIISPDGRELAHTAFFEPAYLDMQVRLKTQLTLATRWGPEVQGVLVALGVAAVIAAILHNGSFVRRHGRRSNDKGAT